MYIRYADGRETEAIILSRTDDKIRVLARGAEDAEEFRQVGDAWVTEACEPVEIEFRWQRSQKPITEADCVCSKELAARLIRLLLQGDGGDAPTSPLFPENPFPEASVANIN